MHLTAWIVSGPVFKLFVYSPLLAPNNTIIWLIQKFVTKNLLKIIKFKGFLQICENI